MFKKICLGIVVAFGLCNMAFSDEKANIKQLETQIIKLRKSFWQDGVRTISDQEYDQLIEKLAKLSPKNTLLKSGKERRKDPKGQKVEHSQSMRSLRKCYRKAELIKWCNRVARTKGELFTIQPKYDGVAVEFNNEVLSTRGDGQFGVNISKITNILRYFPKKPTDRAVGELLLSDVMFNKLQKINHKYTSSRHAVVGMLSSSDVSFWKKNGLVFDFVCYDYVQKQFNKLQLDQEWSRIEKWIKTIGYLTDGFVVKVADPAYYKSLGSTVKFPKGAMAFKWGCERKWTILEGIQWQQGRNGFTPVGLLAEVNLDGKSVRKVSLHNLAYIRKKKLTLGSSLQIECVGGTVPVVKGFKAMPSGQKIELINCPDCQQPVKLLDGAYQCQNISCPAKVVIEIFTNLKRKKVKGFGKKTILRIVTDLKLKSWDDLQTKTLIEIESVKGIGHAKAKALKKALK